MRWVVSIGVLGLAAACTTENPAYDSPGEAEGATLEDPPVETTAESGPASGPASEDGEEVTGEPVCELHPEATLELTVSDPELQPNCEPGATVQYIGHGNNQFIGGNTVQHSRCDGSVCPCNDGEPLTMTLGDGEWFADGIPLPDCGDVALWAAPTPDGRCDWAGMVMFHEVGYLPDLIVSRTLEVPPLSPLTLDLLDDAPCPELAECPERPPGRYALGVYGVPVEVDQLSPEIPVPFGNGQVEVYVVDDRMSSVNAECELQLAWVAQRSGR